MGIKTFTISTKGLYGAQVTPASFLQLNSFKMEAEENHKQFFERMVDHCRQHLVKDEIKIEGRATASDKLTCLSLNLIAIMWMNKIHPKLQVSSRLSKLQVLRVRSRLLS